MLALMLPVGRPNGTSVDAGFNASSGRPIGTSVDAGFNASSGHPTGTSVDAVASHCSALYAMSVNQNIDALAT